MAAIGKRHSSHTKKARTIAGDTIAKGTKRVVTRTGAKERTVTLKSGGATYTRKITHAGGKRTRSAFVKSGGSTTTPPPPPPTPPTMSARKTRILTKNATRINDGYQSGEFSNVKNKSKRKILIRNAKRKTSSSSSNSGNNSGSGTDNS